MGSAGANGSRLAAKAVSVEQGGPHWRSTVSNAVAQLRGHWAKMDGLIDVTGTKFSLAESNDYWVQSIAIQRILVVTRPDRDRE